MTATPAPTPYHCMGCRAVLGTRVLPPGMSDDHPSGVLCNACADAPAPPSLAERIAADLRDGTFRGAPTRLELVPPPPVAGIADELEPAVHAITKSEHERHVNRAVIAGVTTTAVVGAISLAWYYLL